MISSVLIIGPAWIGDMIMAQSLFMTLKRLYPEAAIDVAAPAWCLPLLARMPQVRKAIHAPFAHGEAALAARWRLGRSLAGERHDRAIVLPNSWKSALAPFSAGIPVRTGWRGEMRYGLLNDIRHLDKQRLPLMIDRFNALAYEPGTIVSDRDFPSPHPLPELRHDAAKADTAMQKLQLSSGQPVLALCPGAEFGPAKRWPADKYAEVARAHIAEGWQVWLFGSAAERDLADGIATLLEPDARLQCHNLAGSTRLEEAIDLLGLADAVVTNDSGLMHLAAALGRPLVAIFGSTSPDHTPPLSSHAASVRLGLPCSPCFQRECPLGHTDCMNRLPAAMVLERLQEIRR